VTASEVKKLVTWMQSQGVLQFSVDGLSVQFHPNSVGRPTQPRPIPGKSKDELPEQLGSFEKMFQGPGMTNGKGK